MKPLIGITADTEEKVFKLKHDYVAAVTVAGGLPLIIPALASDAGRVADTIDGLLLPGGDDLSPAYYGEEPVVPLELLKIAGKKRSDFELKVLRAVMKRKKPVLGICYGMQLINVAAGGTLYQDIGFQFKGTLNHREGSHNIEILRQPYISSPSPRFAVNSTHHQAVKRLGRGLEVFALSEDGVVEGFSKKMYPFLFGVQWHLERSTDGFSKGLLRLFIKKSAGLA